MTLSILVLGASYGSLFATKCLMAGHAATLVCRADTAALINRSGTTVRLPLVPGGALHAIHSTALPGRIDAAAPATVDPAGYDLAVLAMQEPQYGDPAIRLLLARLAEASVPCLSLMNMPPLPFLKRFPQLDAAALEPAYANPRVWDRIDPALMTLCSPDPQAFRPRDEPPNVLQVGLATNFKAAPFAIAAHNERLRQLERDIDAVRIDGAEVPVRLRVHASPFVVLAKWPMLLTGNYRCVTHGEPISIRDAVHGDLKLSREIYTEVAGLAVRMGASSEDLVPFEKYAAAAERLTNPSSAARAIAAGASAIERVDRLVQLVGRQYGAGHAAIHGIVGLIDARLRHRAACAA